MQWKFKHWTVHAQNLERKGNESTLFIRTVLHQNKSLFICTKGQMLFWNPFLMLQFHNILEKVEILFSEIKPFD